MTRWAPKNSLAKKIARSLVLAHRRGDIKLGAISMTQCEEWQWCRVLAIGPRMKLGSLWKEHGEAVMETSGDKLDEKQRQVLQGVLCA